jgi:hypothetical protein
MQGKQIVEIGSERYLFLLKIKLAGESFVFLPRSKNKSKKNLRVSKETLQ